MNKQDPEPIEVLDKLERINKKFNDWFTTDSRDLKTWARQKNFLTKLMVEEEELLDIGNKAAFWKAYDAICNITDLEHGDPYWNTGINQRSYFEQLIWWCLSPKFHTKKWDPEIHGI